VSVAVRFDLDRLDLAALRQGVLRDVPVTVLGLARTGVALARFFADAGARVTVYDGKPAAALGEAVAALDGRAVTLACGPPSTPRPDERPPVIPGPPRWSPSRISSSASARPPRSG
jgi:hypothetical protein